MTRLFAYWPGCRRLLEEAEHIFLCLDYDGTLTPIVRNPGAARLARSTRERLRKLAEKPHFTLAVISGRALEDVRGRVGLPDIVYGGNHGLEIRGPGINYLNSTARRARPVLKTAKGRLARRLASTAGAFVEDKGLTLSVHYRNAAPSSWKHLREIVCETVRPFRSRRELRLSEGNRVIEIRPPTPWGKGNAVSFLRRNLAARWAGVQPLTVYVGDDRTDEDAFAALGTGDISVRVGPDSLTTRARYRLAGVGEVKLFLSQLRRLP
ncbi:MAG TPA: trehalose-phosphatase [bacterium]|nr:trehalose-phosphatase [bacterium]HPJ72210.1 trehalose-phosphatase [bacterium]HPQ65888.1 trehalose-phosphatase [bacterium]